MTREPSLIGGVLLLSGCSIGAAMLGLPVLSSFTGFAPSVAMFFFAWAFMLTGAFLLLEVNLWFEEEVGLISMAGDTLGWVGKALTWGLFGFLFYAIMVAYADGSGNLLADFFGCPWWVGSGSVVLLTGLLIVFGTGVVDQVNRFCMLGLIGTYIVLVIAATPHIELDYLREVNWRFAPVVVPAMIISFGYHNLIPTLKTYYQGDYDRLWWALVWGSLIPLAIYLLWEAVILGLAPGSNYREAFGRSDLAAVALRGAVGGGWIVELSQYFSFFAIITSFLAVALSFYDFLADGLHMHKVGVRREVLALLTVGPPFLMAALYPGLFFQALDYAGVFGAVILFGILPACMVWVGRRRYQGPRFIPGGRAVLLLYLLVATGVIGAKVLKLGAGL